jgi:hypothetical protein
MTNTDLENTYREMSGLSHVAALRYIYSLGFYDGAGVTPTALHGEPSVKQAVPAATNKTVMKSKITQP